MLNFWKPNKSGQGSLVSFNLAAGKKNGEFKEGSVFVNIVKQTGWTEETRTGSFKGGETLGIKLNLMELGKMLHVLERNDKYSTYHTGTGQNVSINFSPWVDKGSNQQRGYGLHVVREREGQKVTFAIGFQFGEDYVLKEFLKIAIEHILLANYAEDKRRISKFTPKEEEPEKPNELVDEVEGLFG